MNERQYELIHILLTSDERYLLVDWLAETVNCSEKTVRNDLKYISDLFAKHSTIKLNRKPGLGVFLTGTTKDREQLLTILKNNREKSKDERIFNITYTLLTSKELLTLQDFANQHFTSRANITKDLAEITEWLIPFKIQLQIKQKVGIFVEGEEAKKRSAIAYLISSHLANTASITKLFPEHDVNFIKSIIRKQNFLFTDETTDRLVIHILIMIKRIKQNNPILLSEQEKERTQLQDYEKAQQFAENLVPYFSLKIPEGEIHYLAWHLASGKKLEMNNMDNPSLTKHVVGLIEEMTRLTNLDFNKDITLYKGLYTHLQPAIHRMSFQLPIRNPLLTEIKSMYPYIFSTVITALSKSTDLFSLILLEDEIAYIVLHFQASIERQKKAMKRKKRAIVVCHLGIGMSHLLTSRIEGQISNLQIVDAIGKAEVDQYDLSDIDFIISTVDLTISEVPFLIISPLFDMNDQEKLYSFIQQNHKQQIATRNYSTLLHFIHPDSIFLQSAFAHRYEVVEMLAKSLYENGFVEEQYIHDALSRERTSATSIGSSIAIPHGNPSGILKSGIAVAAFKTPIEWGQEKVSLVFLLAVTNEDPQTIKALFNELSFLSSQHELVEQLSKPKNQTAFLTCFNES